MAGRSFRRFSLVLAASLVLSGCALQSDPSAETASAAEAAVAVKAVSAQIGTLAVSNEFIGTVSPQQQVTVMPMVSGEVDQVYFEVGDEVKAGDVLFHIKDDAARLQKENAELTRKSAEITAQMQLGSSQVMNNISMQSNIRSIEFQIDNAKEQYQAAVDGIIDARDAKTQMENALSEIEGSLAEMNANQERRSEVVANAERYIDRVGALTGDYHYRVAYDYPLSPEHYQWGSPDIPEISYQMPNVLSDEAVETDTEETSESEESTSGIEASAPEQSEPAASEAAETGEGEQASEEEKESVGGENSSSEEKMSSTESSSAEEESVSSAEQEQSESEEDTAQTETQALSDENGPFTEETIPEQSTQDAETEESAYYSQDGTEALGYFFSSLPQPSGGSTPLPSTSLEDAWAAYREQQKIDAAAKAAKELGYDARAIGTGEASSDILEYAAQIMALEYQASQLRSNQTTLDSSIDQAVSARDTTEKTIDFYEDNLQDAQVTYGIANGQAYQDSAAALATQMQAADVGIKSANLQLEYYSPTSPISGTVVGRSVEQYGLAQPGYAAFVISNQDAMNVTFSVSEQVRVNLYVGMPVTLEKNGNTFAGTIIEIGEAVDAQSGGLFVIKAVTEAGGDQLISGTAVKLTVDTFRTDNAVLIPYDAVHFESEQAYVFVVTEDDTAVRTPVTLGLMNEDMVEVTEGLSAGDRLVATWSTQLEDGIKVRVISTQTAAEETGE